MNDHEQDKRDASFETKLVVLGVLAVLVIMGIPFLCLLLGCGP